MADDTRAARLAEALRENLRKRKFQARARKEAASVANEADDGGADGTDPAAAQNGGGEGNESGRH